MNIKIFLLQIITSGLVLIVVMFFYLPNSPYNMVAESTALNQDSLLRAYISNFRHNAKVEILGRKQTIDTINQCVYYEFEDGSRDTLCVNTTYLSPEKLN